MYCLFCGHLTPEGETYCDETCETNHATEDAQSEIDEEDDDTETDPDDYEDALREIDDIPDDETLIALLTH